MCSKKKKETPNPGAFPKGLILSEQKEYGATLSSEDSSLGATLCKIYVTPSKIFGIN